jgi:hypothetical protein
MDEVVKRSEGSRIIDRRLWRIDAGNRELVAERYRTRTGRLTTVWLVPEASLRGVLWVEIVGQETGDPSPS